MGTVSLEEYELMKDNKYRMYVNAVDKALKNFEYSSEWADLISALGKLNKVLSSNTKFPVIPRRIKISKRLAQCMHPALPSGVHLKALETYDIIFKTMGISRLSQELFIYSAGLFPLLGHAATNVKVALLTVYETHFVPLGERLGPGLSGFLSGVLPGLEDGSEYFNRINILLEKVCEGVNPITFYGHLWECLVSNSAVRLPAITFILSHFDKTRPVDRQLYIMGTCIDTMASGLCACFHDHSVLVQRSALDFLMIAFPMHNSQLLCNNLERIVKSALVTILRRDMSLNRRLYAWLLGSEVTTSGLNPVHQTHKNAFGSGSSVPEVAEQYFETYSKNLLISAIKTILNESTSQNPHDIRPYRILVSLLDKADIGPVILDDILYEVFRLLYLCSKDPGEKAANNSDLMKNANLLFSSLEPRYLWQYAGILFSDACRNLPTQTSNYNSETEAIVVKPVGSGEPTVLEMCDLISFLLDSLSLELYSETLTDYLPELFLHIVTTLTEDCDSLSACHTSTTLKLCIKILSRVRPPSLVPSSDLGYESLDPVDRDNACRNKITEPGRVIQLKGEDSGKCSSGSSNGNSGSINNVTGSRETSPFSDQPMSIRSDTTSGIEATTSVSLSSETVSINLDVDSVTSGETLTLENCDRVSNKMTFTIAEEGIMDKCLKQYEKFFITFMYGVRVKIGETKNIDDLFQMLRVKSPNAAAEDRAKHLEELLQAVLYSSRVPSRLLEYNYNELLQNTGSADNKDTNLSSPIKILNCKRCVGLEWTEAVSCASRLLVELSTFQTSLSISCHSSFNVSSIDDLESDMMPDWLKALVVCSCWLGNVAAALQLVTINALLDLSLLCKRVHSQFIDNTSSSSHGVTSVLIIPLLKPYHLAFLEQNTNVFQVIAHWLWEHLGNPMYHVRSAQLLHQLQLMLRFTDTIENCIGESLSSKMLCENERLLSFRKFTILWHVGREITSRSADNSKIEDIFYKSMLKMLDNLQLEENSALKVEAENWLFHAFLRGDTRRLFDPIFTILLDPATARVSVLHARIQCHDKNSILHPESKPATPQEKDNNVIVYSIACGENEVTYHVSRRLLPITSKEQGKILQNMSVVTNSFPSIYSIVSLQSDFDDFIDEKTDAETVSLFEKGSLAAKSDISSKRTKSPCNISADDQSSVMQVIKNNSFSSLESLKNTARIPVNLVHSSTDIFNLPLSLKIPSKFSKLTGDKYSSSNEGLAQKDKSTFDVDADVMVRSYSFSGKKEERKDLEESETGSNKNSMPQVIVNNIISDILEYIFEHIERDENKELKRSLTDMSTGQFHDSIESALKSNGKMFRSDINVLHSHMLLYGNIYDSTRIMYILQTLRNVLIANPRPFLISAVTTTVPTHSSLFQLFLRHRKSIFARGFDSVEPLTPPNRMTTYLEILLTTCLYYTRSYYPNFLQIKLTEKEMTGNRQVQIASVELLTQICTHLYEMVRDSGRGLASSLYDLLAHCKIQKVILYCIYSVLVNIDKNSEVYSFTEDILQFNDEKSSTPDRMSKYLETFQIHLLRLLLSLIILEHEVSIRKGDTESMQVTFEESGLEYIRNTRIPMQPMYIASLTKALEANMHMRHLHQYWTSFVISSLPFLKRSSTKVVTAVIQQLCINIESCSEAYTKADDDATKSRLPPDYAVAQLEAVTILSHYCLLDMTQPFSQPLSVSSAGSNSAPQQIFSSVMHVLIPSLPSVDNKEEQDIIQSARKAVLNILPKIVSSVSVLWEALISAKQKDNDDNNIAGSIHVVKSQIIQLLNKIAAVHGPMLLASFAVVWKDRKSSSQSSKQAIIPESTKSQQTIVQLISSLKAMSVDTFVHTVHQVIKQPPAFNQDPSSGIEVSVLELFLQYVDSVTVPQLTECWGSLLPLLREAPSLSPPSQFILVAILNEYVQRTAGTRMEKKDQKDLQDMIFKLVELCSQVAGACLEQTTWLRRNLAVRDEEPALTTSGILPIKDADKSGSGNIAQYSVAAQTILAQFLAPLLDVGFGSQEKERVVQLLTGLMSNITPYLKNHTQKNASSFYACSYLLSSLSSYQYTRKAWKKDAMDLLLDPNLFQMEARSLTLWRTIVDNLMSQETATFRELLSRISTTQSNSLSLFSSRDQEYEQRAQLLKRLAFVILCSEQNHFNKHMPDIQERLAESLRLPQPAPNVQAQVFLCFRVLLLRMSPDSVTLLWPVIVTEMVQVMIQMEQELTSDLEEFSTEDTSISSTVISKAQGRHKRRWHHRKSAKLVDDDVSINSKEQNDQLNNSNSNGIQGSGQPHWLQLQLAAAKLLKLAVQLPADRLPQFQMYRWAFVGSTKDGRPHYTSTNNENTTTADFVPHVTRITRLMDKKFGGQVDSLPAVLLPSGCGIRVLQDLHPFFSAVSREVPEVVNVRSLPELEHEIELDFIELMPVSR